MNFLTSHQDHAVTGVQRKQACFRDVLEKPVWSATQAVQKELSGYLTQTQGMKASFHLEGGVLQTG